MIKKFNFVGLVIGLLVLGGAGCAPIGSDVANKDDFGQVTKVYRSNDLEKCKVMMFQCEPGRKPFYDSKGCGCELVPANTTKDDVPDSDVLGKTCGDEHKPVCGELQVACGKDVCPPLKQTYSNRCLAEKVNALNIQEGECEVNSSLFLTVEAPVARQKVTSPLMVSGKVLAPWLFEGVAPVEVVDKNDKVLGTGEIKGPSDWMTRSGWIPFSVKISFSKPATSEGYLVLKKGNASGDPSLDQSVKVLITFSTTIAEPKNEPQEYCTKIYKPVCAEIVVQCVRAPCPPLKQTYPNECEAKQAGIKKFTPGECMEDKKPATPCQISGCSNEICSEERKMSACVARPESVCYKTARCEVQGDDRCGWTPTRELTQYIKNTQKNP